MPFKGLFLKLWVGGLRFMVLGLGFSLFSSWVVRGASIGPVFG